MKTLIKLAFTLFFAVSLLPSFAQIDFNGPHYVKYGADAATREANHKNYAFFREAFKMNSYGDATKRLNELVVACPEANENIYIVGIKMFRTQMDEAETNEEKMKYLDEVLRMFDFRIQYFSEANGKVLKYNLMADKIKEVLRNDFAWDKKQDMVIKTAQTIFKEAKGDIDIAFYILYFNTITNKFLGDKLSPELVLSEYEAVTEGITNHTDEAKVDVQKTIDGYLLNSGAATCDNLVALFKPKYEADPNNLDLIKKIMRYLNNANCDDTPFKIQLAEKYYKLDPSADAAYSLATIFSAQKNTEKAVIYFKEAITRETNKATSSKYELRLAVTYLFGKKYELAATYAKRAIASDPRNGDAQFILSQAYAIGANDVSCEAFDKKMVYCLVYSTLEKAKALTSRESPLMNDIDKQMNTIKFHFPNMEEIFFKEGIKEGDSYTVNCGWIKGETKVRISK